MVVLPAVGGARPRECGGGGGGCGGGGSWLTHGFGGDFLTHVQPRVRVGLDRDDSPGCARSTTCCPWEVRWEFYKGGRSAPVVRYGVDRALDSPLFVISRLVRRPLP